MAKILIVDDEIQLITMVQMRLEANGYEVITANDGQEGLEKAKSENPDLIMMDIMMPKMDGQDVLKAIRALEDERGVLDGAKVLMVTALSDSDNVMSAFREQCDGYMVKPIEEAKVRERLQEFGIPPAGGESPRA